MKKKGVSDFIVNIFFILMTILLIGITWTGVNEIINNKSIERAQEALNCVKDIEIEILSTCYENNVIKIKIKNNREIILGDFFLIDLTYTNGSTLRIPTTFHTYIQGYETKEIFIPFYENITQLRVIPKIESQSYLCYDDTPIIKNIVMCDEN